MNSVRASEYDIEIKTRYGWEVINCEETLEAAERSLNEYETNQPEYQFRIKEVK